MPTSRNEASRTVKGSGWARSAQWSVTRMAMVMPVYSPLFGARLAASRDAGMDHIMPPGLLGVRRPARMQFWAEWTLPRETWSP